MDEDQGSSSALPPVAERLRQLEQLLIETGIVEDVVQQWLVACSPPWLKKQGCTRRRWPVQLLVDGQTVPSAAVTMVEVWFYDRDIETVADLMQSDLLRLHCRAAVGKFLECMKHYTLTYAWFKWTNVVVERLRSASHSVAMARSTLGLRPITEVDLTGDGGSNTDSDGSCFDDIL